MPDARLLEIRNGVSFLQCLETCLREHEFVAQWERLSGNQLLSRNGLDRMIDEATGHDVAMMGEFANFVYDHVFRIF